MLVYLTKDDDQDSFVKEHQHGCYYIKCVRSINDFSHMVWKDNFMRLTDVHVHQQLNNFQDYQFGYCLPGFVGKIKL